jgi:hypothetical protein
LASYSNYNNTSAIKEFLIKIHRHYLRNNEYDEGDLIFHRINYKIIDTFRITKMAAEEFHNQYHHDSARRISEGYCDYCNQIIPIIPIIYGISKQDLMNFASAERSGRLIIGDLNYIREGNKVAMFGCKICKKPLTKYGTM